MIHAVLWLHLIPQMFTSNVDMNTFPRAALTPKPSPGPVNGGDLCSSVLEPLDQQATEVRATSLFPLPIPLLGPCPNNVLPKAFLKAQSGGTSFGSGDLCQQTKQKKQKKNQNGTFPLQQVSVKYKAEQSNC